MHDLIADDLIGLVALAGDDDDALAGSALDDAGDGLAAAIQFERFGAPSRADSMRMSPCGVCSVPWRPRVEISKPLAGRMAPSRPNVTASLPSSAMSRRPYSSSALTTACNGAGICVKRIFLAAK